MSIVNPQSAIANAWMPNHGFAWSAGQDKRQVNELPSRTLKEIKTNCTGFVNAAATFNHCVVDRKEAKKIKRVKKIIS